jgi:RNA polymerase sigma-70 factor (ECF subfamily)
MDDKQIVELFWERSEDAIAETDRKYGRYILFIAKNVLSDDEDAREVQNDTYLRTWDSIPPERPTALRAYVGAICRNLALSRYRRKYAEKRQGCVDIAIDELADCLPDESDGDRVASEMIADALNRFVAELSARDRRIFVQRYWYMCSTDEIARENSMNKNTVVTILYRTRNELKAFLEKEGVNI